MKVLILNKREFNKFMEWNDITNDNVETKDMVFISINHHFDNELLFGKEDKVKSFFKRQYSNVMIMHFGDYGEEYIEKATNKGPTGIFTPFKAKKLYEFIKANKDKRMAVVHCAAGISRSGAIGTFIYDMYGRDTVTYEEFKRKNPRICPNTHVYRLLREEANKDK